MSTNLTNYGELLERQAKIQRLGAMPTPTAAQLDAALLDEIGELNHELKPLWCWWKKPNMSNVINRERVLEEAADVLHFLLLKQICDVEYRAKFNHMKLEKIEVRNHDGYQSYVLLGFINYTQPFNAACFLCNIIEPLGFTPEDLAHAYYLKTDENLVRWEASK